MDCVSCLKIMRQYFKKPDLHFNSDMTVTCLLNVHNDFGASISEKVIDSDKNVIVTSIFSRN